MNSQRTIFRPLALLVLLASAFFCGATYAQTGDPIIDSMIYAYPEKGGNNYAPTSLQLAQYPNGFYKCNSPGSPAWESACPSDLTYTPGSNGGYQAFGVGHMILPSQDTWDVMCYWTWYYDPETYSYVWYFVCDYYYLGYVPAHAFGKVAGQIAWSESTVQTEAGSFELSTLALKRASNFTGISSRDCEPGFWFTIVANPCYPLYGDRYVIPYGGHSGQGVTYEDKVQVQNTICVVSFYRMDDASDRNNGCFSNYDSNWWSDLPGPYRDTTKYDSASLFVPGVGVAQPQNIDEGRIYGWWSDYWAWGLDNVIGATRHVGAVTWYRDAFTCVPGIFTLCQFVTEQTFIGTGLIL